MLQNKRVRLDCLFLQVFYFHGGKQTLWPDQVIDLERSMRSDKAAVRCYNVGELNINGQQWRLSATAQ